LLASPISAQASEYHGQVSFGGFLVFGATVTATQGTKKIAIVTDEGGVYFFADLPDGSWTITIEMQCFATIQAEVTIITKMPAGKWELTLLPTERLKNLAAQAALQPKAPSIPNDPAAVKKPEATEPNAEIPKPPEDVSQDSPATKSLSVRRRRRCCDSIHCRCKA